MRGMFKGCNNLKNIDLSNFDTSAVTNMQHMFNNCYGLKNVYVSELWNINNVTSSDSMFYNCKSLTGAVPFDSTKTDVSMANYTNGYLTYKKNTN